MFPIPNPPPSSLPIPSLWVIPVHQPQASSIVHRTWTGNSFHTWYFTCFNAILPNLPALSLSHRVHKTYWPSRQYGGLAVLVLSYGSILPCSILNVLFEHDLSVYTFLVSKAYYPSTPSSEMKSLNDDGLWYTCLYLFSFTKTISFVKYNLSNGFQKNFKICKMKTLKNLNILL